MDEPIASRAKDGDSESWSLDDESFRERFKDFADLSIHSLVNEIRIDQESRWKRGRAMSPAHYVQSFPALRADPEQATWSSRQRMNV